ncbi:MAG TPA: pyridoxamine 5'-phosphate oxidase family protein [Desulfobacterales bacterium]|nr:pyridoxamine 5'-phosphate oxidase family protein [Desulfobacterales bacterium]
MPFTEPVSKKIETLLTTQRLAVLSTQSPDGPYANLVAFVCSQDMFRLFFTTPRTTRKYANLKADPRAGMLIDNRSNEVEDFHRAMAVTATGGIVEITGGEQEDVTKLYLSRHPYLKTFVTSPSTAMMAMEVERYILVDRFQNVTEMQMPLAESIPAIG